MRWRTARTRLGAVVGDPQSYELVTGSGAVVATISRQSNAWRVFHADGAVIGTFGDLARAKEVGKKRVQERL